MDRVINGEVWRLFGACCQYGIVIFSHFTEGNAYGSTSVHRMMVVYVYTIFTGYFDDAIGMGAHDPHIISALDNK